MNHLLIGISGQIGSGKDTLGLAIADAAKAQGYIVYRRAFGDALKEEVADFLTRYSYAEILDFLNEHCADDDMFDTILAQTFEAPPQGFIERLLARFGCKYTWTYRGLDAALVLHQMHDRMYKERYRALLQWWATEYRREAFRPDYWTYRLGHWLSEKAASINRLYPDRPVLFYVPDVRFPNEMEFIQRDGYLINIVRPGHEPATTHKSEHLLTGRTDFNMTVVNDRSLAALQEIGGTAFLSACSWKWGNAGDAT